MRFAKSVLAPLIPALLIAACGGGGGGGGDGAVNTPAQTTAVLITETNSKRVAAEAVNETTDAQHATTAMGVELQASPSTSRLLLLAKTLRTVGQSATPLAQATGAEMMQTVQCPAGGTLDVTGNVADPNVATTGDTLTYTANNCKQDVAGVITTMNGIFGVKVALYEGGSVAYHSIMAYTFSNFTFSDGVISSGLNGDMTLEVTQTTDATNFLKLKASGQSITFTEGTKVTTVKNYTRAINYETNTKYAASLSATVETNNAALSSSKVSYQVSTTTPFVYDSSANTLSAGSITVTGANSALMITVTDVNTLAVQVDTNGDGTYDKAVTATLAELQAL